MDNHKLRFQEAFGSIQILVATLLSVKYLNWKIFHVEMNRLIDYIAGLGIEKCYLARSCFIWQLSVVLIRTRKLLFYTSENIPEITCISKLIQPF